MSYFEKIRKYKLYNLLIFLTFFSLILGFYFDEDSTGGAFEDHVIHNQISNYFFFDFKETFLNYDQMKTRHSPITPMFFSLFKFLNINEDVVRFFNLFTTLVLIYFFYKCLKIYYPNIDEIYLKLISSVIFLSPTIRSLSIWPDSHLYGLIFFVISTYFFIKFKFEKKHKKFNFVILNILFLALSSYIRPSFSLFSVFFFYNFLIEYKFSKKLLYIISINIILSIPAFYYLFVLDVMFLSNHAFGDTDLVTRINLSNKILIISSILLFHLIPFFFWKYSYFIEKIRNFNIFDIIFILCLSSLLIIFFNYKKEFTGGGIFFHLSFLFNSTYLFFAISIVGILILYLLSKLNLNNFLLIIILILSNPQLTIYHKYYDPLLLILFFLLFDLKYKKQSINFKHILFFYFHSIFFLITNLIK